MQLSFMQARFLASIHLLLAYGQTFFHQSSFHSSKILYTNPASTYIGKTFFHQSSLHSSKILYTNPASTLISKTFNCINPAFTQAKFFTPIQLLLISAKHSIASIQLSFKQDSLHLSSFYLYQQNILASIQWSFQM